VGQELVQARIGIAIPFGGNEPNAMRWGRARATYRYVERLRKIRRRGDAGPVQVAAADPLNLTGILTPEPRVPTTARSEVRVG